MEPVAAAFDVGMIWTVIAIGTSGAFTASFTGLGGALTVAAVGATWVLSAAVTAAYPSADHGAAYYVRDSTLGRQEQTAARFEGLQDENLRTTLV
jgi:hypothetical protein